MIGFCQREVQFKQQKGGGNSGCKDCSRSGATCNNMITSCLLLFYATLCKLRPTPLVKKKGVKAAAITSQTADRQTAGEGTERQASRGRGTERQTDRQEGRQTDSQFNSQLNRCKFLRSHKNFQCGPLKDFWLGFYLSIFLSTRVCVAF